MTWMQSGNDVKLAEILGLTGIFKPDHATAIKRFLSDIYRINKDKLDCLIKGIDNTSYQLSSSHIETIQLDHCY